MTSQYRAVQPAQIKQRKASRHPVKLERKAVRCRNRSADQAELIALSIYGCQISTNAKIRSDERLSLKFKGARPVPVTAVWCDDHHVGCRFDDTIDQKLFRKLTLPEG